jgi:hypothetical protein
MSNTLKFTKIPGGVMMKGLDKSPVRASSKKRSNSMMRQTSRNKGDNKTIGRGSEDEPIIMNHRTNIKSMGNGIGMRTKKRKSKYLD